jgi:hypothetical protein
MEPHEIKRLNRLMIFAHLIRVPARGGGRRLKPRLKASGHEVRLRGLGSPASRRGRMKMETIINRA